MLWAKESLKAFSIVCKHVIVLKKRSLNASETSRRKLPYNARRMRPATKQPWLGVSTQLLYRRQGTTNLYLHRSTHFANALNVGFDLISLYLFFPPALTVDLLPEKRVLSVTVPKEFHFKTNNQSKTTAPSNTSQKESDFILQLRKPATPVSSRRTWSFTPTAKICETVCC